MTDLTTVTRPYTLADAEALHAESPDTFWIAPRAERAGLAVGDLVKLCFVPPSGFGGERMWVKVTDVYAGRYTGSLDNDPAVINDLQAEDFVTFGPEHIYDIWAE